MRLLLALALALIPSVLPAQVPGYVSGQTYWGANHYIEYIAGDAPIVLSAPHDGTLTPSSIPNRTYGVFGRDTNSQLVARAIAAEVFNLTGRRAHVIICHLHRSKLDANRAIVEAAQGNVFAEQAWRDWHRFIDDAKSQAVARYGRGSYIDVHGHGHPQNWTELGYLLSSSQLALSNAQLNQPTYINRSAIRALANRPGVNFPEALRGQTSLGGYLEQQGFPCVPSPANPSPAGAAYFNGGYNTSRHGSSGGGTIDATQFELPWSLRQTASARSAFGRASADAILNLLARHSGMALRQPGILSVTINDRYGSEPGDSAWFTVRRAGSVAGSRTVRFTVTGRATANVDYVGLGTTVVLPPGQATVDIEVRPLDDTDAEGMETVTLELVDGRLVGRPARATAILLDDETDPTLQARWSLNAMNGTEVPDDSGRGRNGALRPSAATGPRPVSGRFHGALWFDEIDDHVSVPAFGYAPSGDVSLAFWFRAPAATSQSSFQYVFSHGVASAANSLNVYFFESTGVLRTNLVYRNNLSSISDLDVPGFMDGRWHHYALSASARGLTSVYIDGLRRAAVRLGGNSLQPAGTLRLGARQDLSSTRYYGGGLDEVRVYGRAIEAAEAAALFAMTPPWVHSFGSGCAGTSGVPLHSITGTPSPGFPVVMEARRAPASAPGILGFGRSITTWGGLPLPLDLGALGAPGCLVLTGPLLTLPVLTDPGGQAQVAVGLPLATSLLGQRLHTQYWFANPPANPLGIILSNGATLIVGGLP